MKSELMKITYGAFGDPHKLIGEMMVNGLILKNFTTEHSNFCLFGHILNSIITLFTISLFLFENEKWSTIHYIL